MGAPRLELGTSALSGLRSNQLSYAPERRVVGKFGQLEQVDRHRTRWPFINRIGHCIKQLEAREPFDKQAAREIWAASSPQ